MKQIYIEKQELLSRIIKMNKNSITVNISGEDVFVTRKVLNILLNENVPTFIVERKFNNKVNKWIAIPMTL